MIKLIYKNSLILIFLPINIYEKVYAKDDETTLF